MGNIKNSQHFYKSQCVDLHTHSSFSDGLCSPDEIIRIAAQRNLSAISIADHDNVGAVRLAYEAASKYNIEYIPGIEISARHNNLDLHMLGYFFDYEDAELCNYVQIFQNERKIRADKIIGLLNDAGYKITLDDVLAKAGGGSIGRPHISDVLIDNGYVKNRLEAFDKLLGDDCTFYVPKYKISPQEAVELIHQAKGLVFIAHPGLDLNEATVYELIKMGIDGIETMHPKHAPSDTFYFRDLSAKYNLLESGGSDCHGDKNGEGIIGEVKVSYLYVEKMKQKLRNKYKHHPLL